ncbi:hypothetical protein LUZ62_013749 [Rhynchospora pubera]|uniref:Enoyl-CoA hydratase n=1 Tax=Rhynchospora pubera TaxID=906938 RepID=A0AAV8AVD7_9POAL|nr:hypothetical protein LUZ62_013749 [Rhynchospora pubera]
MQDYTQLELTRHDDGVLVVTMNRPEKYNATDEEMHGELARVFRDADGDPDVRVVVVTGAGKAFSAGGDLEMVERMAGDHERVSHMLREMSDMVYGIIECEKPVVSAINGVSVGAGTVVGLLSDISICAEDAKLGDGHVKLGVAAGDHAAIIWPLLTSMAKARYYLMTGEMITGAEAERIGLVSKALPREEVLDEAMRVAKVMATGSQQAIRLTKRTLNSWVRQAAPIFDQSAAYEMLCFMGPDVVEGYTALREKRAPAFPSAARS